MKYYAYIDNSGLYTFIQEYIVTGLVILPDIDEDYKDYMEFTQLLDKYKGGE